MNDSEEPSNTVETKLTIVETSSIVARLKRGFYCENGCYFSIEYTTLATLALLALIAYIIYVYGFNYGVWDPNFRHYCNNYGINNCG